MAREKKETASPFDYSKNILNGELPMKVTSGFVPFIVNRSVALHRDCLASCQILNELKPSLEESYTFLFYQIPKKRRPFEKWISNKKPEEQSGDEKLLADFYQCSLEKARQYMDLVTSAFMDELRKIHGGKEEMTTRQQPEDEDF